MIAALSLAAFAFGGPSVRPVTPPTALRSTSILTVPTNLHLLNHGAPLDLALILSPTVGSTLGHTSAVVLPCARSD